MVLFALTVVAAVLTVVRAGQRDCREQCTSSCSPPSCFSPLTPVSRAEVNPDRRRRLQARMAPSQSDQPTGHAAAGGAPETGRPGWWPAVDRQHARQLRQVLSGHRAG